MPDVRENVMKPIKKKVVVKVRNWQAVNAHFRKAGSMKDHKKEASKKACRGKVVP